MQTINPSQRLRIKGSKIGHRYDLEMLKLVGPPPGNREPDNELGFLITGERPSAASPVTDRVEVP
jgi:hypothetical protein